MNPSRSALPPLARPLLACLLSLSLAACTVYVSPDDNAPVRPEPEVRVTPTTPRTPSARVTPAPRTPSVTITPAPQASATISEFVPTRGEGAVYSLGETISFRVLTQQDGYLTLISHNSDGSSSTFATDLFVRGGTPTVIPDAQSGVSYQLAPPRGEQRIEAVFSSSPGGGGARDSAETSFFLR